MLFYTITLITTLYVANIEHVEIKATNNSIIYSTIGECEKVKEKILLAGISNNSTVICAPVVIGRND